MNIILANGQTEQLNDLVNLDFFVSRSVSKNQYFSPREVAIWKSKVTHFDSKTGIFRERVKGPHGSFVYKIAQVTEQGEVINLTDAGNHVFLPSYLTAAESLTTYKQLTK
jgi:hypothetical protein